MEEEEKNPHASEDEAQDMGEEPGTVLWAKLAGYPWWPARVAKETEVSANVRRAKRGARQQLVYFFGSQDYAWVSQVEPWKSSYERNSRGSKAKAFVKGLREAKAWLSKRNHAFPVYAAPQPSSSPSSSELSSDEEAAASDSDPSSSGDERRRRHGGARFAKSKGRSSEKRNTATITNKRKGRGDKDAKVHSGVKKTGKEASEGDAESRRNAKRRRLELREKERQERDADSDAVKRRQRRHTIQRRLGLRAPADIWEIRQRERKPRDAEADAAPPNESKRSKRSKKEGDKERDKKEKKKKAVKNKERKRKEKEDQKGEEREGKRKKEAKIATAAKKKKNSSDKD